MSTLSFETGIKTFDINGDPERAISFNPTDVNFIHRLYDAFGKLEALRKANQLKAEKQQETKKVLQIFHQEDLEIRRILDGVFGPAACAAAFGDLAANAVTSDGLPLWGGFIVAVLAQCDTAMVERQEARNPKLEALLAKYKK